MSKLALFLFSLAVAVPVNYIVNGDFSSPAIALNTIIRNTISGWNGTYFDIDNHAANLGFGQFIDLQGLYYQNGYIEQYISLPTEGFYVLSFYQKSINTLYNNHVMQIHWNGALQSTKTPNTTNVTFETLILFGLAGVNILKFTEIGIDADYYGMFIDQVTLVYSDTLNNNTNTNNTANTTNNNTNTNNNNNNTNTTNNTTTGNTNNTIEIHLPSTLQLEKLVDEQALAEQKMWVLSILLSLPVNQVVSLRCAYLLIDDLWLYYYDIEDHEGVLHIIFSTITKVEMLKFEVLQQYLGWSHYSSHLNLSDYSNFSRPGFVEIEKSSSVLLDSNFAYFIYTIPQNVVVCLVLFLMFRVISQYRCSLYVRRFYFLKYVLSQVLIQANLAYFVYVCFSHLSMPFSFVFSDKASFLFTTLFLLVLLLFGSAFYLYMSQDLKKKSGYFIFCYYRSEPCFWLMTFNNLAGSFGRGAVHYFLRDEYWAEIVGLCTIQIGLILITAGFQLRYGIYIVKGIFSLNLIYHFLFILLNLTMCIKYYFCTSAPNPADIFTLKAVLLDIQQFIIYSLITIVLLIMIFDFVPLNWFKSQQLTKRNNFSKDCLNNNHKHNASQFKNKLETQKLQNIQKKDKKKSKKIFKITQTVEEAEQDRKKIIRSRAQKEKSKWSKTKQGEMRLQGKRGKEKDIRLKVKVRREDLDRIKSYTLSWA